MLELASPRLLLRDFRREDEASYLALRSGERFGRYYPAEETSTAASRRLLGLFIDWQHAQPRTYWQLAITLGSSGQLLGSCGVRTIAPGQMAFGCELGEAFWGQAYAAEAAERLFAFAAAQLACRWLVADTLAANTAAIALAQRLGFALGQEAGAAREFNGQYWPVVRLTRALA